MSRRKADTSFTQLTNLILLNASDPKKALNLIETLRKTIPVRRRKNMPKIDPNLNKKFRIKRINYEITAWVDSFQEDINSYCIKVLTVTGETKICPGVLIFISKRELELTGRAIA